MKKERPLKVLLNSARYGSIFTKLSFIIMGAGCFRYGQIIKGLIYLLTEISFVLFFSGFSMQYLPKFSTLGNVTQQKVWNEELQIFERQLGDNSMLILLYSILSLAICVLLIFIWYSNIKSSYQAQLKHEKGIPNRNFMQDVARLKHERFHATLLTFPMLTMVLFTILPIIFMILIAFTNFDSDHQPPGNLFTWTGISNISEIFVGNASKSHTFFSILAWTIVWAILATFTNYIFGMILAIILNNKKVKLKKLWRTCFIISIAIPQFVSLLLISKAFEPQGAVNLILMKWGWIEQPLQFMTNPTLTRIVVVVINMWIGIPYTMMTFSGILMNIPADLYESAAIDGAGPIRKFFKITLPYMVFVTAPATITTFVTNFNNFNVIYLLTGGGPFSLDYYQAGKTDLLVTWLYKLTVNQQDYSLASTIGILIFVLVGSSSLIVYNLTGAVKKEDQFQ